MLLTAGLVSVSVLARPSFSDLIERIVACLHPIAVRKRLLGDSAKVVAGIRGFQASRVFGLGHIAKDVVGRFGGGVRRRPVAGVEAVDFDHTVHSIVFGLGLRYQCAGLPVVLAHLGLCHVSVLVVGWDGVHVVRDALGVFQCAVLPVGVLGAPALRVNVRSY